MMTTDRTQGISAMTTRQKVMAGVFALILIIIVWQLWGMLRGPRVSTPPVRTTAVGTTAPGALPPASAVPQPAMLPPKQQPQPAMTSQREAELLKAQQEAEAKYLQAINELQMLRIERDIAETTKEIMAAKLDTITSQKKVVDMLKPTPVAPTIYTPPGVVTPGAPAMPVGVAPPAQIQQTSVTTTTTVEIDYAVISVSQLQGRWSAVLGRQGVLYNVYVNDILPADRTRVVSIDRSGVVLEKEGVRKRISLVPII